MSFFKTVAIIVIVLGTLINFIGNHYKLAGNFGSEGKSPIRLVVK